MLTKLIFLDDPYRIETTALVVSCLNNCIVLDETVFYPGIGVSPADSGEILLEDGRAVTVSRAEWHTTEPGVIKHICKVVPADIAPGRKVIAKIDWPLRYAAMRTHTALHLVAVAFPYPVIDGEVYHGWGSATFEVDKTGLAAQDLQIVVDNLIMRDLAVDVIWTDRPLRDQRVKAGAFNWPGSNGRMRAIRINNVDIQPCDGLHVKNTNDIGRVRISKLASSIPGQYRCAVRVVGNVGNTR